MRVLGLDIGGTSTRAAVSEESGRLLGYARTAGANLRSSTGEPREHIAEAVQRAGAGPVDAVAVGAAGAGDAGYDAVVAMITQALSEAGVRLAPTVATDLDIAYRAGGVGPAGVLLLSGTGAVAARYENYRCVQRCDGMGWALGDQGSGTWLGWEVLRAAAADLDGRGDATELTGSVLTQLGIAGAPGDPRQAMIDAVGQLRPAEFAGFAPLALESDDVVAQQLVTTAQQHLARSADAVGAAAAEPMVLAGGLLSRGALHEAMTARYAYARYADWPVAGACALAAATLGAELDVARLAAELTAQA